MKETIPVKLRILNKVKIDTKTGCWLWPTNAKVRRYAAITVGSRSDGSRRIKQAHRISYEEFRGPIPDGLEPDHLCKNTYCVNPWHLEPVTHYENWRRGNGLMGTKKYAASITHCPHGHEYTKENTRISRHGHRICRKCHNYHVRADYMAKILGYT